MFVCQDCGLTFPEKDRNETASGEAFCDECYDPEEDGDEDDDDGVTNVTVRTGPAGSRDGGSSGDSDDDDDDPDMEEMWREALGYKYVGRGIECTFLSGDY